MLATLTSGISFADVLTAIGAIGALVIAVDLAQIGYFKVRHILKAAR